MKKQVNARENTPTQSRRYAARVMGFTLAIGFAGSCGMAQQLTFWHGWTGGTNTEAMTEVINQYNQENPDGISIQPTALEWDQLFSKWVISAATGQAPDVVMLHNSELTEFAQRGILQPLDDLVETVGLSLEGVPESVIEASRVDGQLYCVTGDLHPMGMYYNVDLVEKAGLDPNSPPTTAEELLDWAEKLTVRDANGNTTQWGIYMPSTGAVPRWFWYSLLIQYGGSFLSEEGQAAVDSEASRKALQFTVDLIHTHEVAAPATAGGAADPVAAQKVGIWFSGPWEVNQRLEQELNFRTAPMPVIGDQPAAWGNTHCMGLSAQRSGDNYEAGTRFIKWFFENYALPAKTVGIIPVAEASRTSEVFVDDVTYQYYEPFIEELPYVALEPSLPQYTSIFSFEKPTPLSTNLEAAMRGSKNVEQALSDMKSGVDEQLARGN